MFRMVIPFTFLASVCAFSQAQPAPRPSPVVSAEPADPPGTGRPSAFAPRVRPAVHRTVVTERREETFVIPAGTRVEVRLAQTLDTRYMRPGDSFAGGPFDRRPAVVCLRDAVVVCSSRACTKSTHPSDRLWRASGRL